MAKARSLRSFPLPVKRGEGAEPSKRSEDGEAGEGHLRCRKQPLTRLAAAPLATLSSLRGERDRTGARHAFLLSLPRLRGREGRGT